MSKYLDLVAQKAATIKDGGPSWAAINPEYAARMELQNRFKTGLMWPAIRLTLCAKTWPIMTPTAANTPSLWVAGTVSPRNK